MRFKVDNKKESSQELSQVETEEIITKDEKTQEEFKPELTHLAISIFHDLKTNMFHLVRIEFNPLTRDVGTVIMDPGTSRVEAEYSFQITAGGSIF